MFYIPPSPGEQLRIECREADKKQKIHGCRFVISSGLSFAGLAATYTSYKYGATITDDQYNVGAVTAISSCSYYGIAYVIDVLKTARLNKQMNKLDKHEDLCTTAVNAWQRTPASQPTLEAPDPYRALSPLAVPAIKFVGNHIGEHGGIIAQAFGPENMERISSRREAKTEYERRTTRIERARDTIGMLSGQFRERNSYTSGVTYQKSTDSSQSIND
jgi:hypothetical protein